MPSSITTQLLLLFLGGLVFAALVWLAGDILALFVICFIFAYLFDPLTTWLQRRGMSRAVAAAIITSTIVLSIGATLAIAGPLAYQQMQEMVRELQKVLTGFMREIRQELRPYFPALQQIGLGGLVRPAPTEPRVADVAVPLATSLATTFGLLLLTPVVTFYLLKDWQRMLTWLVEEAPEDKRPALRYLGRHIDSVMAAFLHGQAWVCLCCAVLYSIGLYATGLNYAIVIGVMSGAFKFLPYIGTAISVAIAVTTGVTQGGWDSYLMLGIGATYLITELIESSFLSPWLIGDRVRLNPALVIFAVLLGGKLWGVLGIFIAIPVMAVAKEVLAYWWRQQRQEDPAGEEPQERVDGREDVRLLAERK
ncbi:MAG: AI-2E family transporter [Proteobacteria bacterium]|nr:AI-2E family transporter [Pseudomonadota bacterium]